MSRKSALSREKTDRMKEVQAEVGRRLREEYGTAQPLPDRLTDLLREIEQSTRESRSLPLDLSDEGSPLGPVIERRLITPRSP